MSCEEKMSKFKPAVSLCGDCARATVLEGRLGCDWFRERKPPYGVRYQKRYSRNGRKSSKPGFWLYVIVDCPDFIAEGSNASLEQAQKRARIGQTANEKNYLRLAEHMVKSIADDYRFALKSGNESRIKSLEKELRSEQFYMIGGIDGDAVIRQMRKEMKR